MVGGGVGTALPNLPAAALPKPGLGVKLAGNIFCRDDAYEGECALDRAKSASQGHRATGHRQAAAQDAEVTCWPSHGRLPAELWCDR
jgi:hypothetical protein